MTSNPMNQRTNIEKSKDFNLQKSLIFFFESKEHLKYRFIYFCFICNW